MTWLLPSALGIGALAAIAVVALHFIARSRPLAEPLPTARFIPPRPVTARARATALSDVLLLLIRAAAVLAIAAAIAAPVFTGHGRTARIVLVDRSRDVANATEVSDSARAYGASANAVIAFDSVASSGEPLAALDSTHTSSAPGSLSAALASALRAAGKLPAASDSVELVVVSPVAVEEMDAATMRLRAMWPGRIRLIPVRGAVWAEHQLAATVRADPGDAVASGLALMGLGSPNAQVRVIRGDMLPTDSSWAADSGHVLVHWPATQSGAEWPVRSSIDAIGAVTSRSGTLVARFPRLWVLTGDAVARWSDGEPAAVENAVGSGCIRHVGILIDQASDITLHAPFRAFVRGLLAPCGGEWSSRLAAKSVQGLLTGSGPLAVAVEMRDRATETSRWTPWLLALGALLLVAELGLRRVKVGAA